MVAISCQFSHQKIGNPKFLLFSNYACTFIILRYWGHLHWGISIANSGLYHSFYLSLCPSCPYIWGLCDKKSSMIFSNKQWKKNKNNITSIIIIIIIAIVINIMNITSIIVMIITTIIIMITLSISRFNFEPLPSVAKSGKAEGNALAKIITGGWHHCHYLSLSLSWSLLLLLI